MNETLRPSTLGEILDRTFQLYRNNFWRFAGIAALPLVLAMLLAIPAVAIFTIPGIAGGIGDPAAMIRGIAFGLAFVVLLPLYLAFYALSIAGITEATVSAQRGERPTIRTALKGAWPRLWTYSWLLLLQAIVACLVPMCAAVVVIGPLIYLISRSGAGLGAGFALGFLVFAVGGAAIGVIVWLALSFSMGMAVCVAEKKTAWQSLRRSWRLSQGTRGRIFVLYLLVLALSFVALMISYFVLVIAALAASLAGSGSAVAAIVMIAGGIVYFVVYIGSQIALAPVPWLGLVLFYYDQRIRKEGYDIEWMMQQAGLTQPQPQSGSAGILGLAQPPSNSPPADGPRGFPPVTPPDTLGER
jgi:hypothetical protein